MESDPRHSVLMRADDTSANGHGEQLFDSKHKVSVGTRCKCSLRE